MPIKIWEGSSAHNTALELSLSKGEWQLSTEDAVYSDGSHYRPLRLAFRKLKKQVNNDSRILVLGAGLGSAVSILDKMKLSPRVTLVDIDEVIIRLSRDWLFKERPNVQFICRDAAQFVGDVADDFDVIVVDIFKGREVPGFVTSPSFLQQCSRRLTNGGCIVMNYIINQKEEWETLYDDIHRIFPTVKIYDLGINRVIIARA